MSEFRCFASLRVPLALLLVSSLCLTGCSGGGGAPTAPPGGGGGNHAPTANLNIDKSHLAFGQIAQLTLITADADGDQVTTSWSGLKGTVGSSGPTATTATFTAGNQWGAASATATVSDGRGGTAQATAQTYIRNPSPPQFTLRPVASTQSNCGGFALEITTPEAVVITQLHIWPNGPQGQCSYDRIFSPAISLAAGQTYVFRDPGCIALDCFGNSVSYYEVVIDGRRPEPDGGSFIYDCPRWRISNPSACQ